MSLAGFDVYKSRMEAVSDSLDLKQAGYIVDLFVEVSICILYMLEMQFSKPLKLHDPSVDLTPDWLYIYRENTLYRLNVFFSAFTIAMLLIRKHDFSELTWSASTYSPSNRWIFRS